jgi:hypothetical protein
MLLCRQAFGGMVESGHGGVCLILLQHEICKTIGSPTLLF